MFASVRQDRAAEWLVEQLNCGAAIALLFPTRLEPREGEQEKRYDERAERMLDVDVLRARLEPWQERRKAAGGREPVHGGKHEEHDAKKSGD